MLGLHCCNTHTLLLLKTSLATAPLGSGSARFTGNPPGWWGVGQRACSPSFSFPVLTQSNTPRLLHPTQMGLCKQISGAGPLQLSPMGQKFPASEPTGPPRVAHPLLFQGSPRADPPSVSDSGSRMWIRRQVLAPAPPTGNTIPVLPGGSGKACCSFLCTNPSVYHLSFFLSLHTCSLNEAQTNTALMD